MRYSGTGGRLRQSLLVGLRHVAAEVLVRRSQYIVTLVMFFALPCFSQTKSLDIITHPQNHSRMYNITYYDLSIMLIPETKSVYGDNTIFFKAIREMDSVQFDLDARMKVKSVFSPFEKSHLKFRRIGNYLMVYPKKSIKAGAGFAIKVDFQEAAGKDSLPQYDGGFAWEKDASGFEQISTLPKTKGSPVFWPCKNSPDDLPDSMSIQCMVPAKYDCQSIGKAEKTSDTIYMDWTFPNTPDKTISYPIRIFSWKVNYPINPADVKIEVAMKREKKHK